MSTAAKSAHRERAIAPQLVTSNLDESERTFLLECQKLYRANPSSLSEHQNFIRTLIVHGQWDRGEITQTPWGELRKCVAYDGLPKEEAVQDLRSADGVLDALYMDQDGDIIYREPCERPLGYANGIGVEVDVTLDPMVAVRQLRKIAASIEVDGYYDYSEGNPDCITAAVLPDYVLARLAPNAAIRTS